MRVSRVVIFVVLVGCKGPMAKIEAARDALAADDMDAMRDATQGFPLCTEKDVGTDKACLVAIANAFGSKNGYNPKPPDQAAAATAALLLVREQRGEWLDGADAWMGAIAGARGAGADALRLATARQMAAAAPVVGKKIDDDTEARTFARTIGPSIPGACPTYAAQDDAKLPVELRPDFSACVQKDLGRKDGPGGTYGRGAWRAAEGALALWRDELAALKQGAPLMTGKARATLDAKIAVIEAATAKAALKRVPPADTTEGMREAHADAGVRPFYVPDAGAAASAH